MAKRCRKVKDSDGPESADTLFITTSLGTRLVTTIHNSATVANGKRKIELEHSQVYPAMGELKILTLQVEHQGSFYCLTDSMPLASAYVGQGSSRSRSLFIEASCSEHDEKVGIIEPEVKNRSSLEGVDHANGNVEAAPDLVGQGLLSPAGREVSVGPTDGHGGTTAAPIAQFTNQEKLPPVNATSLPDEVANQAQNQSVLPDHLDPIAKPDDGSQHVALDLQNDHPAGTDEELTAGPSNSQAGSKETSISHGTKNKKAANKEVAGVQISSVGEQSKSTGADSSIAMKVAADDTVNTDKNDSAVPQIENDRSNIVEMDRSVSADLLVQSEATGGAGSISPKRKKRKVEKSGCRTKKTKTKKSTPVDQNYSVGEQAATDDGLSCAPFEKGSYEDTDPQITLTQDAVKQVSESVDVSDVLSQGEGMEVVLNQEATLPPTGVCLNEDIDGNVSTGVDGGANEEMVVRQPEDVQGQALNQLSKHHSKEKKKRKRSCSSAAEEDISTSGMKEQSHGVEGSVASLTLIQEVGNETLQSIDVSLSNALKDDEALQTQKVLLALGPHPDHENTEEMDGIAREVVETAKEKLVAGHPENVQGLVLDQLGKHQENDISGNRKEKKKKKRSHSSAAEDISTSGMKEQSQGAEGSVAPLTLIQEVGNETSQFINVSVSVAPGDGEEALQMQEVLLPLVAVHPDHENTGEIDGNEREEVENATEKPVTEQPNTEDPALDLGRHQENGSSLMTKEKKKKKRPSEIAGRRKLSKGERAVHSTDTNFQNEKDELGTTSTEVLLQNRPETEINDVSNDVSKGADEKINFLNYFMPGQSQSEIISSVKVKGTSKSTKEKKMKDQNNDAGGTILEKGRKPATASRDVDTRAAFPSLAKRRASLTTKSNGPEKAVQNTKIAKQHQVFNRNAMSTGKGSSGRSLLKSSGKDKSLFNKERKLFSDSESDSSTDENKTTNSDASTLPPSGNSSSDSSSGEESDASQDSKRKGTEGTGGGAGPSVSNKKKLLGIGEMSMDAIIKSSKRFKKAKFTASQSQEPDSQANG